MKQLLDALGLIGGSLFGAACLPMAYQAIRNGNAKGIPTGSIWLFTSACITFFGYLFLSFGFQLPFVIGIIETSCWLTVMKYRYFPRES